MKPDFTSSLAIMLFALLLIGGCKKSEIVSTKVLDLKNVQIKTCDSKNQNGFTTVNKVIYPDPVFTGQAIKPWDVTLFSKYNYGKWHFESGVPYQKKLELMPDKYSSGKDLKTFKLLSFFTITDIHLTDKESPAQSIEYTFIPAIFPAAISCYTPSMLFSTHVLNSVIQTVNEINQVDPIDFGISLGDMTNSSIYNEFRWFIDIIDGKNINPDSGKKDDPVHGPGNDYQDKYQAEGLCKSIPWYTTIGNHDHFFNGAIPFNNKIRKTLTGNKILQLGNLFTEGNAIDLNTYSMGTLDGSTVNGDIIGAGVVDQMNYIPTIPADLNRRALTKMQMMKEFSKTSSIPRGHGFNQPNFFDGCYTFEPKSDLPLKVIVLDDTMDETDTPPTGIGVGFGCGSLSNGRFEWLTKQLQTGQKEDKLMIIAAHIPIGVAPPQSILGWMDGAAQDEIIAELKKYPNFILWISGHRHLDTVTAFPSTDKDHAENGFWEVETRSLREFPQQFRIFDILSKSDNTLSIQTADVDPDVRSNSFAATSRSYAIAAYQTYGLKGDLFPSNVNLVKKLTPHMQSKIAKYKEKISH